jgi:hypothetical protein
VDRQTAIPLNYAYILCTFAEKCLKIMKEKALGKMKMQSLTAEENNSQYRNL